MTWPVSHVQYVTLSIIGCPILELLQSSEEDENLRIGILSVYACEFELSINLSFDRSVVLSIKHCFSRHKVSI